MSMRPRSATSGGSSARDTSVAAAARKRTRNVAVLFVDIEGCTRLCEDLSPREMDRVIERYFSRFLDVVRDQGGEVTEILGDGLLALFPGKNVRRDAMHALAAAFGIQEATAALNATPRRRHDPIVVNIGINAGAALVGTTRLRGRTGEHHVFAARGPVTNIAARVCALATDGQILVTGDIAQLLGDVYPARKIGRRRLKNVRSPVEILEIRNV